MRQEESQTLIGYSGRRPEVEKTRGLKLPCSIY